MGTMSKIGTPESRIPIHVMNTNNTQSYETNRRIKYGDTQFYPTGATGIVKFTTLNHGGEKRLIVHFIE